jgi:hypothetical protein
MGRDDIHALAGAYALDALTGIERATFARHAAECEVCAVEVAELQETAGRIAEVNWSVPPPRLRRAVLDEVSRTRQRGGHRREEAGTAAAARWRRRTAMAVAAGILAAGGGVATWSLAQQRVRDERARVIAEQERTRRITAILSAPDARLARKGPVSIVVSPSRNAGVAVLNDLGDPGPGKAYQLWMIGGGNARSVAVLAASQRSGTFLVDKVAGAKTFGVSREPAGGSTVPSAVVATVDFA